MAGDTFTGPAFRGRPMSRLMTLREVAVFLAVNERTVRRMLLRRELPCVRVGVQLRFDPSDVLRWVRQRKEG